LTDAQDGFRENKSTATASHIFTENIQESMDKWVYILGVLFYLAKAYDVINHEKYYLQN